MNKITQRDTEIVNFVREFKAVNSNVIQELYFPSVNMCNKRLKILTEMRKLNRYRKDILQEYTYYIGKRPTNIKHSSTIANVYSKFKCNKEIQIVKYKKEYPIKYANGKELRTDLMVICRYNNRIYPLLIEADLSHRYKEKYTEYIQQDYYKNKFMVKPIIISISNFEPASSIDIHWIKLNELDKLENIFK